MKAITILIKPSSSKCNINCEYCFYDDVSENRETKDYGFMSLIDAEILINRIFEDEELEMANIAFQGGEPTLIGLDYYKEFVELTKKYNIAINFSMQTNGMNINEEFVKFLKDNNFLIGVSLDGYADIHNLYRKDYKKIGTHKNIINTINLFNKYEVDYNIVSVVTKQSAKHIKKIYKFFKKNNFRYLQFIYCLNNLDDEKDKYSLDNDGIFNFLDDLFNLWYEDFMNNDYISVRNIDNMVHMMMGMPAESCNMKGHCSCQFVVESNLDVFPCDFYVLDEWKLGNLKDMTFEELLNSDKSIDFIKDTYDVPKECQECEFYNLCRNGCRRERVNNVYVYCGAYKKFYKHNIHKFNNVINKLQRG